MNEVKYPILPWSVYGYTIVASFTSFVYGYNTGMIASAILFIPKTIPLSVLEVGAVVSVILLGAMVGSFFSGILADYWGRKKVLAGNNILMLIAALTAALGDNSVTLIISRLILGIGVGFASVVPGLYITEIAPSQVRGKLGAINQLNGWAGIIVSYFVGYEIVTCTAGERCWRFMFTTGAVLCMFHLILTVALLPETPRWLVNNGRSHDALAVLTRIYGDVNEQSIIREYQSICSHKEYKEPLLLTRAESRKHSRVLWIAMGMQLFQQFSGNSAVVYYTTMVFHDLGYSNRESLLYNALACIPQLLMLFLVIFYLDRAGRRPALLASEAGLVLSLGIIGMATLIENLEYRFWILLVGVILHRIFFAVGLGPVPTVLVAESLPFEIRGRGLALSLSLNWFLNFIVTASFPILFTILPQEIIYWIFAFFAALGFIFVSLFVNETKGLSLDNIEGRSLSSI